MGAKINSAMKRISLPPRMDGTTSPSFPLSRQVTIVGGSGAGKSRFMHALMDTFGAKAFSISALGTISREPAGSVEQLFNEKMHPKAIFRDELYATDLDRLGAILFHDEFRQLLSEKRERLLGENKTDSVKPTNLDHLVRIWQDIFPGNTIMRDEGRFLFATPGGPDLISTGKLSASEKTVLYYIAAVLYAPAHGVVFVDNPAMFLHPAMLHVLWNAVEGLRPDCTFVYNTSDVDFMNSRTENVTIWVKSQDTSANAWDYEILPPGSLPDDLMVCLLGTRRPVLFIEGDATHSIDAKLYPLVFPRHSVRPLGSCNKVIEATRSFCDMKQMHHMDSFGIVDRDRRTSQEVEYLRRKNIMVPEVAEIENIFILEDVMRIMAHRRNRDADKLVGRVKRSVLKMFETHFREQVLQHVRHRMKRLLECRGDARVKTIKELEQHLRSLPEIINVRASYDMLMGQFESILHKRDYAGVLRVFNHKPMLSESRVASLLGYNSVQDYISGVLHVLKGGDSCARDLREAIRRVFMLPEQGPDSKC